MVQTQTSEAYQPFLTVLILMDLLTLGLMGLDRLGLMVRCMNIWIDVWESGMGLFLFKNAMLFYPNEFKSDHRAVLLYLNLTSNVIRNSIRPFRLLATWLSNDHSTKQSKKA